MKKITLGGVLLLPLLAMAQSVEIKADRDSHVYACGEPAAFSIRVLGKDKQPVTAGQLRVSLTNFGPQQVANATFDLAQANPVTCSGTLREPGFLKCTAAIRLEQDGRGLAGAAYEPEKIAPGSARPGDADAIRAPR